MKLIIATVPRGQNRPSPPKLGRPQGPIAETREGTPGVPGGDGRPISQHAGDEVGRSSAEGDHGGEEDRFGDLGKGKAHRS
jgi:hypothetical protein